MSEAKISGRIRSRGKKKNRSEILMADLPFKIISARKGEAASEPHPRVVSFHSFSPWTVSWTVLGSTCKIDII